MLKVSLDCYTGRAVVRRIMRAIVGGRPGMLEIILKIDQGVLSALRRSPDEFANEMHLAAAIYWYKRGEISQEKAAQVAGLGRTDFLLTLAREGEDAFVVDLADLERELRRTESTVL